MCAFGSGPMANDGRVGDWLYVWLAATYLETRQRGWIVPVAAIIAVAENAEGRCKIIGLGCSSRMRNGRSQAAT